MSHEVLYVPLASLQQHANYLLSTSVRLSLVFILMPMSQLGRHLHSRLTQADASADGRVLELQ